MGPSDGGDATVVCAGCCAERGGSGIFTDVLVDGTGFGDCGLGCGEGKAGEESVQTVGCGGVGQGDGAEGSECYGRFVCEWFCWEWLVVGFSGGDEVGKATYIFARLCRGIGRTRLNWWCRPRKEVGCLEQMRT